MALGAALAALIVLAVVLPGQAQAWTVYQTCSGQAAKPESCVHYDMEGQVVGRLLGGVKLAPFTVRRGYIQIWTEDGKTNWRSPDRTFTNGTASHQKYYDGFIYNTWTAPSTRICARWIDSTLGPRTPACWTTPG